jgi:hypothetical protein
MSGQRQTDEQKPPASLSDSASFYLREITKKGKSFDASWPMRSLVKPTWAIFGPKSPLFGLMLFVTAFFQLCRAEEPALQCQRWFVVIAVATTCVAAGVVASEPVTRYFMPFVATILLTWWQFARNHLFAGLRFSGPMVALLRRFGCGRLQAAACLNVLLLTAIVLTFADGGIVQSLAACCSGKCPPICPREFPETERHLAAIPADAVLASNYGEFLNLHHPTRNIVCLPPTLAEFTAGKRNGELQGLVFFFRGPDERNASAWAAALQSEILEDGQGNRFTRTLAKQSPYFEIYVFRREASSPAAPEPSS